MASPNTLVRHYWKRWKSLRRAQSNADWLLRRASDDLADATTRRDQATAALAERSERVTALRRALGNTEVAPEADENARQLEAARIDLQVATRALMIAREDLDVAAARRDRASADRAWADGEVAAVEALLREARRRHAKRQAWLQRTLPHADFVAQQDTEFEAAFSAVDGGGAPADPDFLALLAPPSLVWDAQLDDAHGNAPDAALVGAPAEAAALLGSTPDKLQQQARERVAADLPEALLTRALDRAAAARARLAAEHAATLAARTAAESAAARLASTSADADRALESFAQGAVERLAIARSTLTSLSTAAPLLSAAVRARIAALAAAATAALAAESAHDATVTAWRDTEEALTARIAEGEDAEAAQPTAAVTLAVTARGAAHDGVVHDNEARDAASYRATVLALDQLEAAIPDAVWQRALDFSEASAALEALSAASPTALGAAVLAAESAWADALDVDAAAARLSHRRRARWRERAQRGAAAEGALQAVVLAALRGDQ